MTAQTFKNAQGMAQALPLKIAKLQQCLADLRTNGADQLVESVVINNTHPEPIIRLRKDPGCAFGASIIRTTRQRIFAAAHLGCQLRWPEAV